MKEKRKAFYKVCFSYWYHERFKPFVKKWADLMCLIVVLLAFIAMLIFTVIALSGLYTIASTIGYL